MNRPVSERAGPGQESVWDYPRPPRLEVSSSVVEVVLDGVTVARTDRPMRVLETSHPPTYYLPLSAFLPDTLRPATGRSFCEWKGTAAYLDVVCGLTIAERAGWHYPNPTKAFSELGGHVALYPALLERCTVDGEVVGAQPGGFYGGWVTSRVVGPFKGEPGTRHW